MAAYFFNVYCYNVQPGVGINYENGDSWLDGTPGSAHQAQTAQQQKIALPDSSNSETMVHITATGKKYHRAGCRTLKKSDTEVTLDEAKSMGLSPCGICNPPQ